MSHCSPAQIHLVNIPSCIVSLPLRWEGGGMRQRFTAVLLLLVGLPWKTELQKAAEDKEFEVKIQPQHVSLVSLMRSHFLHSTSGKASCCKYLQLSHQQGWNQSGGHGPFPSGKPTAADKVQKFSARAELLPQSRTGTLKTGGCVQKLISFIQLYQLA